MKMRRLQHCPPYREMNDVTANTILNVIESNAHAAKQSAITARVSQQNTMEDEEWQSAALGSRHMHNRVHQGKHSRHNRPFDVYQMFASYACKCATWEKSLQEQNTEQEVTLELYRLSPDGKSVVGEIYFPGMLKAAVVLAASRTTLDSAVKELERETSGNGNRKEQADAEEEEDEDEVDRFQQFEKNSFRAPKFWLQWNGVLEGSEEVISDRGYVVFSGNDCRKFKGTITCAAKGWKDVAISGHKVAGRKSSDVPINWNGRLCNY